MCCLDEYLAVLALVGIADSKARDAILIRHCPVDIQECERSVTALLSVHADGAEATALCQIVVKSDSLRKVGARVQRARALIAVNSGSGEGVLEDPVGAGLWAVEAGNGAVAGRVDAILAVEVDHGHDTSDIDAREVSHTSAIVGWSLELRELVLGDLALADGVV